MYRKHLRIIFIFSSSVNTYNLSEDVINICNNNSKFQISKITIVTTLNTFLTV
jgi:hypothetical protein